MNVYAEAIAILENPNADHRALLFEIAKHSPSALVDANRRCAQSAFEKEAISLWQQGLKVDAVRMYRMATGASLGIAKHMLENASA